MLKAPIARNDAPFVDPKMKTCIYIQDWPVYGMALKLDNLKVAGIVHKSKANVKNGVDLIKFLYKDERVWGRGKKGLYLSRTIPSSRIACEYTCSSLKLDMVHPEYLIVWTKVFGPDSAISYNLFFVAVSHFTFKFSIKGKGDSCLKPMSVDEM